MKTTKSAKKLWGLLLAVLMAVALLSAFSVTAFAEETETCEHEYVH